MEISDSVYHLGPGLSAQTKWNFRRSSSADEGITHEDNR